MNNDGVPGWQKEEWKRVHTRREKAFGPQPPSAGESEVPGVEERATAIQQPEDLVGLAVSGGGIRSALYSDGFLQGLSHRGFLRYVDYICSVSGGGYIAGHLTSQADDASDRDAEGSFHDDKQRRDLGRDSTTGKIDTQRLSGIGGYLSRPLEFLPAYLWSFFFSFAFYIGAVGIMATLAALFWRSFDDPLFRQMLFGALGLNTGNELTVAFFPAIVIGLCSVIWEIAISLVRTVVGMQHEGPRRVHIISRKIYLFLIVFSLMTSVAIFLGNGITNTRSNAAGFVRLNYFTQYFAITAAAIQIFVFLGRDRLFRSERAESKQWQKYVQQLITTVTLLFLVFSMIHWMGREDISEYTSNRDPHLVRGDVMDWHVANQLFSSYQALDRNPDTALLSVALDFGLPDTDPLDPLDGLEPWVKPQSQWLEFLAVSRLIVPWVDSIEQPDYPQPPSPLAAADGARDSEGNKEHRVDDIWSLQKRVRGACVAYALAMSDREIRKAKHGLLASAAKNSSSQVNGDTADAGKLTPESGVTETILTIFQRTVQTNQKQTRILRAWNRYLQETKFTEFLINGVAVSKDVEPTKLAVSIPLMIARAVYLTAGPVPFLPADRMLANIAAYAGRPAAQGYLSLSDRISELLKSTDVTLTEFQRDNLLNTIRRLRLVAPPGERSIPASEQLKTATANRLLIEGLFPAAFRLIDEPSTVVVPPHDQQARRQWLCFWMVLMLVGMVGGLGPTRVATVFQFYRQQLANNFLVASHGRHEKFSQTELYRLNPSKDGLPYPLMLAATLEPTTHNGSYRVDAEPFVFSPLYCGRFGQRAKPIPSKQLSFSQNPAKPAVNLGDAITLSGAAVTPLMTGNRWLSMILDFFNTGIGQRLQRVDRTSATFVRELRMLISTAVAACLGALLVARFVVHLNWPWSFLASIVTALLSYCLIRRIGSPGLIRSLILPHAGSSYGIAGMSNRENGKNRVSRDQRRSENPASFYVADGGYSDYLGVTELLRRRCDLIVVSDAGANIGGNPLGTLAQMCEKASREMGIRFLDLDHEAPIDFGRLEISDQRLVHQPYLCMRIRYPGPARKEGHLFYCQMSITDTDPIEIQNIRNLFPSFPDEPTVNQFYSENQVIAYRALGYHIANRLCNELERWQERDDELIEIEGEATRLTPPAAGARWPEAEHAHESGFPFPANKLASEYKRSLMQGGRFARFDWPPQTEKQPLFNVLQERLLTAYRLACYEELTYRKDDIFSEAIWASSQFAFPTFRRTIERTVTPDLLNPELPDLWLSAYERSADVRSAYRTAIIRDINALGLDSNCLCADLWSAIESVGLPNHTKVDNNLLAAHLTTIGTACQEVHRGRPHSTFQIGGRQKLIHLCLSMSQTIVDSLNHSNAPRADEKLQFSIDGVMSELIELERSVFQGSEHVATISFAQCMSMMWGCVARFREVDPADETLVDMRNAFLHQMVIGTEESQVEIEKAPEIRSVELRRRLHDGLAETELDKMRDALVKNWYIGYFTPQGILDQLELQPAASQPVASQPSSHQHKTSKDVDIEFK